MRKMLQEPRQTQDRERLGSSLRKKRNTIRFFSDIIEHLLKAEQWVEDAEFA